MATRTNVTISVLDTDGNPKPGLAVYVFNGTTYSGLHGITDAGGQVSISLPGGSYRFRSDLNNTQFWSQGSCDTAAGCSSSAITVSKPVSLTVKNSEGVFMPDIAVYAFSGGSYQGYGARTNEVGQVSLTLPPGSYRFRADIPSGSGSTSFWSSSTDACTIGGGCEAVEITVSKPISVTVKDSSGAVLEGLNVYAFNATTYAGYSAKTDANGQVSLVLPFGDYRFRADLPSAGSGSTPFWSSATNQCSVLTDISQGDNCTASVVTLPGGSSSRSRVTIDYTYDSLNRLTAADQDDGTYYHYVYDPVGNRLSQTTQDGTVNYQYDESNRLTSVDGQSYTWDDNGNLLSDGATTYSYDSANRLTSVSRDGLSIAYAYSGLGDRMQQTVNGTSTQYTLDISPTGTFGTGLTQVLQENGNTYLYGNGRIAQVAETQAGYFLPDVLGSVRQVADGEGALLLARSYDPYGNVISESGEGESLYGYTGEQQDGYIKTINLRARIYSTETGRFLTKDTWEGDYNLPESYNGWLYTYSNPVNLIDPNGQEPCKYLDPICQSYSGFNYRDLTTKDNLTNFRIKSEYGWTINEEIPFTEKQKQIIYDAGSDWQNYIDKVTGGYGKTWINFNTGNAIFKLDKNTVDNAHTINNEISLPINFEALSWKIFAKATMIHELTHIWDINSYERVRQYQPNVDPWKSHRISVDLAIFLCVDEITALTSADDPRSTNPGIFPEEHRWPMENKYTPANGKVPEYLAYAMEYSVYRPQIVPSGVKPYLELLINATVPAYARQNQ